MTDFVDKADAWEAITNKNGKIAKLCDDIDRWKESDSLMQCRIDDLKAENERLRTLLMDAIEDETEFETEWNKAARAALGDRHE